MASPIGVYCEDVGRAEGKEMRKRNVRKYLRNQIWSPNIAKAILSNMSVQFFFKYSLEEPFKIFIIWNIPQLRYSQTWLYVRQGVCVYYKPSILRNCSEKINIFEKVNNYFQIYVDLNLRFNPIGE